MARTYDRQPKKLTEVRWAVYNWGFLWDVFQYRREAVKHAQEKWEENKLPDHKSWKEMFEVRKVRVIPI